MSRRFAVSAWSINKVSIPVLFGCIAGAGHFLIASYFATDVIPSARGDYDDVMRTISSFPWGWTGMEPLFYLTLNAIIFGSIVGMLVSRILARSDV